MSEEKQLADLFYSPLTGLQGLASLQRVAKEAGLKMSKPQIAAWYKSQAINQIHKPAPVKPTYIPIECPENAIGCLQMDLMEITKKYQISNGNNRFILNIIDITSRYAWSAMIRQKTTAAVLPHLKAAVTEIRKHHPKTNIAVTSDDGNEFKGAVKKWCESENITQRQTLNKNSLGIVERFNQTLWKRIRKLPTLNWRKDWESIIKSYNSTPHSGREGLKPIDIFLGKERPPMLKGPPKALGKFSVGDTVRYLLKVGKEEAFTKKSLAAKWSNTVHTIVSVKGYRYTLDNGETYLARELLKAESAAPVKVEIAKKQARDKAQQETRIAQEGVDQANVVSEKRPRETKQTKKFKFSAFEKNAQKAAKPRSESKSAPKDVPKSVQKKRPRETKQPEKFKFSAFAKK